MKVTAIFISVLSVLFTTVYSLKGIFRTDSRGRNTLIEYDVFGTKFGICSLASPTQNIEVEYEESNGVLRAQTAEEEFEDPISQAIRCRLMASRFPAHEIKNISPFSSQVQNWVTGMRRRFTPTLTGETPASRGDTPALTGGDNAGSPEDLQKSARIEGTYTPWGFSFGGLEKTGTNNFPQFGVPKLKNLLGKLIFPANYESGTPVSFIDLTE